MTAAGGAPGTARDGYRGAALTPAEPPEGLRAAMIAALPGVHPWGDVVDQLLSGPLAPLLDAQAAVRRVEALAEEWRYKGEFGWGAWQEGHGPDLEGAVLDQAASDLRAALTSPAPETTPCWCIACEHLTVRARTEAGDPLAMFARRFIVCSDCGNKRCPKATHHNLACTGSNEPGQPGSAYAQTAAPPASVQELRDRILGDAPHTEDGR